MEMSWDRSPKAAHGFAQRTLDRGDNVARVPYSHLSWWNKSIKFHYPFGQLLPAKVWGATTFRNPPIRRSTSSAFTFLKRVSYNDLLYKRGPLKR